MFSSRWVSHMGKTFFFFPLNWHWIGGTGDTEESEECVCVISFFFFFFKATTIYSIRVGNKLGQSDGLAFLLPLKICFYLRNKLYGMHFSRRTINYVQFSVLRGWRGGIWSGKGLTRLLWLNCYTFFSQYWGIYFSSASCLPNQPLLYYFSYCIVTLD